jgi:hypothetical protein
MNNKDAGFVIGVVVLCVIALAAGPILLIWSINTLFGVQTPLNWTTWFAALLFLSLVKGSVSKGSVSK